MQIKFEVEVKRVHRPRESRSNASKPAGAAGVRCERAADIPVEQPTRIAR
jgi:hypothetical protein